MKRPTVSSGRKVREAEKIESRSSFARSSHPSYHWEKGQGWEGQEDGDDDSGFFITTDDDYISFTDTTLTPLRGKGVQYPAAGGLIYNRIASSLSDMPYPFTAQYHKPDNISNIRLLSQNTGVLSGAWFAEFETVLHGVTS